MWVWNARLHADSVANLQVFDGGTDFRDDACCFVPKHHRSVQNERTDGTVLMEWGGE